MQFDNPPSIEQLNFFDRYISPTPLEYRIQRFQELVKKGVYYRIMTWNIDIIMYFTYHNSGKFKRPTHKEAIWKVPGCFY
jgi:hypothetical protein